MIHCRVSILSVHQSTWYHFEPKTSSLLYIHTNLFVLQIRHSMYATKLSATVGLFASVQSASLRQVSRLGRLLRALLRLGRWAKGSDGEASKHRVGLGLQAPRETFQGR